jgi:hypothetical protein
MSERHRLPARRPNLCFDLESQGRPIFTVRLKPLAGVDALKALRFMLKHAKRSLGLVCVGVVEQDPPPAADLTTRQQASPSRRHTEAAP